MTNTAEVAHMDQATAVYELKANDDRFAAREISQAQHRTVDASIRQALRGWRRAHNPR